MISLFHHCTPLQEPVKVKGFHPAIATLTEPLRFVELQLKGLSGINLFGLKSI